MQGYNDQDSLTEVEPDNCFSGPSSWPPGNVVYNVSKFWMFAGEFHQDVIEWIREILAHEFQCCYSMLKNRYSPIAWWLVLHMPWSKSHHSAVWEN